MKPRRNYDSEFPKMAVDLSHHSDDIGRLGQHFELEAAGQPLTFYLLVPQKCKNGGTKFDNYIR